MREILFDYDFEGRRVGVVCEVHSDYRVYRKLDRRTYRRAPTLCRKLDTRLLGDTSRSWFRAGLGLAAESGMTQKLFRED